MLTRAIKTYLPLFLLLIPIAARAKVIEQLIAVIDGEPYTLSNLETYAKSKMNRSFPTGDLGKINDSDREDLQSSYRLHFGIASYRDVD